MSILWFLYLCTTLYAFFSFSSEELVKIVKKVTEESRVSIRSIRRESNERIKVLEKDKKITEDESFKFQTDIQKLTDRYIQMVDQTQDQKEKELTQV